jgi:PAS domain-containing protein
MRSGRAAARPDQRARGVPCHRTQMRVQRPSALVLFPQPALQLIYDTALIGLACLSPDCRYLQINQRLTEICRISVEDHLGRTARDCVPALAGAVEDIVRSIMENGEPVTGIEVAGQRADQTDGRFWIIYWHPLSQSNVALSAQAIWLSLCQLLPLHWTNSTASANPTICRSDRCSQNSEASDRHISCQAICTRRRSSPDCLLARMRQS